MGIYDRDYYRESSRGLLGSVIPEGGVCKFLIAALIGGFLLQFLASGSFAAVAGWLSLQPERFFHGEIWRIVTFGFLHPSLDPIALIFSLLFLWWFGSDLEQLYGSLEFFCFAIASMVIGGLVFTATAYIRGVQSEAELLGALGPVTAVTVLYAWHFPSHTVRLFFILPVPIWVLAVIEVAAATFVSRDQAAYVLAGAAFGSLYYRKQWRLSGLFQGWPTWSERTRPRGKLRVFRPDRDDDDAEPVAVASPKRSSPMLDEHLEAKVDALLEKMARSGKESLSDQERQILLQASEIYRRRRN